MGEWWPKLARARSFFSLKVRVAMTFTGKTLGLFEMQNITPKWPTNMNCELHPDKSLVNDNDIQPL